MCERDDRGRLVLRRHADVVAVAHDPDTFSSRVSAYRQIPNGLDGPAHRDARHLLDPFFSPPRLERLRPGLEDLARSLVPAPGQVVDAVAELGARYSVRAASLWLGWPAGLEDELLDWVADNRAATRSGDRARTAAVAARFDEIVHALVVARCATGTDVTAELIQTRTADGRPLHEEEVVSILRNWTGGDLSTLALCVGVVAHGLAVRPEVQRALADAPDEALAAAIDELLRIDDPFISSRRRATADTQVGECPVATDELVVLHWPSANRDPRVFGDPDAFAPVHNAAANLVYGAGAHVCPGRPLATLELVVLVRALLRTGRLCLAPGAAPERETPPAGGFRRVDVLLESV
ncbi:cytochrome P450 [Microbacterium horticulturae]|uniref:Cytochrome P450 n=1 Tax=Microbacterium horticulturae TaxID=3028316 RepID=A0ABY8C701_9MICO|nr:cytochrome P450 [Microbacterium sp. KACC 23027]WEG10618.1 cytochrome P450 [Microbacterium sp. KACC 23027]